MSVGPDAAARENTAGVSRPIVMIVGINEAGVA